MDPRSHALDLQDVSNSMMRRLFTGILLAFLLLNATIAFAGAEEKTYKTDVTQNQFAKGCRTTLEGTSKREATHVVSCTYGNGSKTTCDFNQKPATCTDTPAPKAASTGSGALPNQEIQSEDTSVVNPAGVVDTEVVFEEVSTGQSDPASAPNVVLEEAVEPELPANEGDQSVQQEVPADVEELPVFGE